MDREIYARTLSGIVQWFISINITETNNYVQYAVVGDAPAKEDNLV